MIQPTAREASRFDTKRLNSIASAAAVILAIVLPWSTSATEICAWLWFAAFVPTLDTPTLRRTLLSPAGGLPVFLFLFALVGMLWADVSVYERLEGLKSFYKLLFVPLLFVHFSRSGNGNKVLNGFLVSCGVLLVAAFALPLFPHLPVRDYFAQTLFAICAFVLLDKMFTSFQDGRRYSACILTILTLAFLAGVVYAVPTSRTGLTIIPVLFVLFAVKRLPLKAWLGLFIIGIVVSSVGWLSAPTFRNNILNTLRETSAFRPDGPLTRAGERIDIWFKSIKIISKAPVIGHGTGSIAEQFLQKDVTPTIPGTVPSTNPFNQVFAIAIQLGALGSAVLIAMWVAHLWFFWSKGFAAWFGLVVVVQNIVGCLFNTHLSDFGHGWAYVLGIGVAGGMVLKNLEAKRFADTGA